MELTVQNWSTPDEDAYGPVQDRLWVRTGDQIVGLLHRVTGCVPTEGGEQSTVTIDEVAPRRKATPLNQLCHHSILIRTTRREVIGAGR